MSTGSTTWDYSDVWKQNWKLWPPKIQQQEHLKVIWSFKNFTAGRLLIILSHGRAASLILPQVVNKDSYLISQLATALFTSFRGPPHFFLAPVCQESSRWKEAGAGHWHRAGYMAQRGSSHFVLTAVKIWAPSCFPVHTRYSHPHPTTQ